MPAPIYQRQETPNYKVIGRVLKPFAHTHTAEPPALEMVELGASHDGMYPRKSRMMWLQVLCLQTYLAIYLPRDGMNIKSATTKEVSLW